MMGDVQYDDLGFGRGETYDKWKAYGQAKTANALFANEVARRCKEAGVDVLAYSLHPGGMSSHSGRSARLLIFLFSFFPPLFVAISTNLSTHITDEEFKAMGLMDADGVYVYSPKDIPAGTAT